MEIIKRIIRKLLPKLFPSLHIIFGYIYDARKFIITNTDNNYRGNRLKHDAIIIRLYHGIEKAFSLPQPRLGFGKNGVLLLIEEVSYYYSHYKYNSLLRIALDSLVEYRDFHIDCSEAEIKEINKSIDKILHKIPEYNIKDIKIGGAKKIYKSDIYKNVKNLNFKNFCECRYSIRDFAEGHISDEIIIKAIEISQKTPSACNRQAWKARVFRGDKKNMILGYQNGNRGFKESIDTVLLITGLTTSFSDGERNQVFIDGGLFSMSLIYALHSMGVGVCALNTAFKSPQEKQIRKAINLNIEEVPIMMLAIGQLKETFIVANSPRKSLSEILVFNS